MDIHEIRKPGFPVNEIFIHRWSPRSFTGEDIPDTDLMSLFEAARWAPSSANNQPWRFIYGKRNTPSFKRLFDLLMEGNRPWCEKASALVLIVSKKTMGEGKPNPTHSFDTGSAWENLALQGSLTGFYCHGMAGFDYDRARAEFKIPADYQVEAMCAIGRRAPREQLPERYQSREEPSARKPLSEFVFEGEFKP